MVKNEEKIKILNFLQDFGCLRLNQLQILFNKPNDNFKNILTKNFVYKKGDIFIHNNREMNSKMIVALGVLCKYKKRLKCYWKRYEPVYITFLTKEDITYNIIVSDKENEKGLIKLLKTKSPIISEADKFILLFQDNNCFKEVECSIPYIYCTYPDLKIIH